MVPCTRGCTLTVHPHPASLRMPGGCCGQERGCWRQAAGSFAEALIGEETFLLLSFHLGAQEQCPCCAVHSSNARSSGVGWGEIRLPLWTASALGSHCWWKQEAGDVPVRRPMGSGIYTRLAITPWSSFSNSPPLPISWLWRSACQDVPRGCSGSVHGCHQDDDRNGGRC